MPLATFSSEVKGDWNSIIPLAKIRGLYAEFLDPRNCDICEVHFVGLNQVVDNLVGKLLLKGAFRDKMGYVHNNVLASALFDQATKTPKCVKLTVPSNECGVPIEIDASEVGLLDKNTVGKYWELLRDALRK